VTQTVNFPLYSVRIDPRTGGIPSNTSTVNTWYHGMIVTLRKPTHNGLEFLANYTYSHATDNGTAGAAQLSSVALDPYNYALDRENSSNDVRHRFTPSVVYAPTFAKNLTNKAEKEALDGWSISSSLTISTGGHYTASAQGSSTQSVVICGVALANGSCNYTGIYMTSGTEITTGAKGVSLGGVGGGMTGAGIGSTGTPSGSRDAFLTPGSFVLPNLYNLDLRLSKEFAIKEKYHIELRVEAFNVFNTSLVQGVNSTAVKYIAPGKAFGVVPGSCPAGNTTCMAPLATFGVATNTGGPAQPLGARQMQAGIRFDF